MGPNGFIFAIKQRSDEDLFSNHSGANVMKLSFTSLYYKSNFKLHFGPHVK